MVHFRYHHKELKDHGYNYDYNPAFIGKLTPVKGTAQDESKTMTKPQYYNLSVNPFKNIVATIESKFRLNDSLDLKVLPYFWYGYGTGGTEEQTVNEGKLYNPATGKLDGKTDINGDGDTLDTIIVDNGSITRTARPGVTSELIYSIGDHQILGGVWIERARHEQTGPAVGVTADGFPYGMNYYQEDGRILRPGGHPYEYRDGLTKSNVEQAFLQDTITMLDDKAQLNLGLRAPRITRNFTNFPNEGSGVASPYYYNLERTWSDVLPNVGFRYRVTNDDQLYTSITKNMKAPANYALFPSNANVQVDAQGQVYVAVPVKKEVSYDTEIGYRHQSKAFIASVSVFNINFRDRQASSVDPITGLTNSLVNVGKVHMQGAEFEIGNTPINGWSFYGSLGYLKTEILSDLLVDYKNSITLPLTGNQYPLSPKLKANLSAEYQQGAAWGRLKVRATSKQQADLLNTEVAPGYTLLDFDAGYTFADYGLLKHPKLTFNLSNILNREYRNPTSNGGTNATAYTNAAGKTYGAKTVYYYLGAPRFASLTLQVDF